MFIRRIGRKNGSTQIKIVENVRDGEKVFQKVLCVLGAAQDQEELQSLEKIAKTKMVELCNEREPVLPGMEEEIYGDKGRVTERHTVDLRDIKEEKRFNVGLEDVFGAVYSQLDFEEIIVETRKDEEWNHILKQVVFSRIFDPNSKKKTSEIVLKDLNQEIPVEKIYRMMDRLVPLEEKIKSQVFQSSMSLLDFEVDILFFDVTTLYFESFEPDELRAFGFSKDCKFKETQIVLALVTNNRGVPLTYEIFPGNKGEGDTLVEIVKKLKAIYAIKNVVIVADRAMFSEKNLTLLETENIRYIVAAKLKPMSREIHDQFLTPSVCSLEGWIKELEHKNRRLIVSYSLERAKCDYKKRKRLVDRLLKKAENGKISIKNLINNNGTKKYIEVSKEKALINEAKISSDSQWDGIHGVITNYSKEDFSANDVLEKYKGLWKIEEVFRVNKNDLKMRPIYHFKPERIRAHILICFIAYTLLNTTKEILEKNSIKLSVAQLRKEVEKRQVSVFRDKRSQRRYLVPAAFTDTQKQIYRAFRLSTSEAVQPLFKV